MGNLTQLLEGYTEFDLNKEAAILQEIADINGFSQLVPENSARYFDVFLDTVVRHRERFKIKELAELAKHAILFREDFGPRYEHSFYEKYLAAKLTQIEAQLKGLVNERYVLKGRKRILAQTGKLVGTDYSQRDYTSMITLESLLEQSREDEHFRFDLVTNGHQQIKGEVYINPRFNEFLFGQLNNPEGSEISLKPATAIKVLDAVKNMLLIPTYHIRKATHRTNRSVGKRKKTSLIDLEDEKTTTANQSICSFAKEDLERPDYLDGVTAKLKVKAAVFDEKPVYVVIPVNYSKEQRNDGSHFINAGRLRETSDLARLDQYVREALEVAERAVVAYEQGYISRNLKGLPPGTSPRAHTRRVRKKKGEGAYKLETIVVGRKTEEGKTVHLAFERLKRTREQYFSDFQTFLETPQGSVYMTDCAQLIEFANQAAMIDEDKEEMLVALGVHYKTGMLSEGFQNKPGEPMMQIYRKKETNQQ